MSYFIESKGQGIPALQIILILEEIHERSTRKLKIS